MNWSILSRVTVEFLQSACKRFVAASFVLLVAHSMTAVVPAQQSPADPNDRETIKQLLKRVEELEARLKRMEARQTETATAATSVAIPAGVAKETETEPSHSAPDHMRGISPALQIRGFSDVTLHASDLHGEKPAFAIGQLDLFITSRLSEKLSVLAELVLEANDENAFGFEAERLLLNYRPSDYFNVSFGRYHTGIGYYNAAYHHGTWFQTATGRPFILRAVCRMSETDFNQYLMHSTFTGQVQGGPKLLTSAPGVRKFIYNVPGAIGYLRAAEVDRSVKVVRIEGRLPGDEGYRLKLERR